MKAATLSQMVTVPTLTASFDRAARSYPAHARVQIALADWLAEWLPVRREGAALEIGAGTGLFTRRLLPWRGPLLATDLAPAMCEAGQTALPQANWRTLAAEAPEGGPWNWIFSSSMLQWAAEPEQIFAAWRDQLAPDGRILAGLFVEETLPELRELIGKPDPLLWRTVEEWRECLNRGGLRVVRDATERRVFRYPSTLSLLRDLHGTGTAPTRRVSPGWLRRLLREYELRHGSADGVCATWTFYRFEADQSGLVGS